MRQPKEHHETMIQKDLMGNYSRSFLLNNCTITIHSSIPEETACSGLFCDKQRIHEIAQRSNQGCGCYSMLTRRSNLVIDHSLTIESRNFEWKHYCEHFSSNKFSMLYQSSPFPSTICASDLQFTDEYFELQEKIERVVDLINSDGGFTV